MRKNVLIKTVYNCQSNWITNSRKPNPEKKQDIWNAFQQDLTWLIDPFVIYKETLQYQTLLVRSKLDSMDH